MIDHERVPCSATSAAICTSSSADQIRRSAMPEGPSGGESGSGSAGTPSGIGSGTATAAVGIEDIGGSTRPARSGAARAGEANTGAIGRFTVALATEAEIGSWFGFGFGR